jgi:hypothetical protein
MKYQRKTDGVVGLATLTTEVLHVVSGHNHFNKERRAL